MDEPPEKGADKGWAWVVAIGMSVNFLIVGGFVRGFGIFYSALVEEFESSASMTSMIQGFRFAALCISAPIVSSLSERFTERKIIFVGSGVFSLALILSYFAPNLEFTVFTLGAMTGLGMALLMTPAQIVIGKYFDKYRSLANSITFCGSSAGMMAIPPLIIVLMENYGLRGSFLIYGALFLNCAVCGALVRPLANDTLQKQMEIIVDNTMEDQAPTLQGGNSRLLDGKESVTTDNSTRSNILQELNLSERDVDRLRKRGGSTEADSFLAGTPGKLRRSSSATSTSHVEGLRQTSLHSNDGGILLPLKQDVAHEEIVENESTRTVETERSITKRKAIVRYMKSILDVSLFKNARCMLFLLATSCAMIAFANETVFLIPRAEEYGIPREKGALLLSIAGGCDIIGRLIIGAIADIAKIGPSRVMIGGLIMIGISTCLLPLAKNFTTMVIYSVVFGLVGSSGHLLCLPIMILFVGRARMPRAMGLVMSCHGIASAISPPFLGYIKDLTGTYDSTFYICGAFQIFSSALMLLEPIARKHDIAKHQIKMTSDQ